MFDVDGFLDPWLRPVEMGRSFYLNADAQKFPSIDFGYRSDADAQIFPSANTEPPPPPKEAIIDEKDRNQED
jgi:hypothetical protein